MLYTLYYTLFNSILPFTPAGTADFNVQVQWVILLFTGAIDRHNMTLQINNNIVPFRDRFTLLTTDRGLRNEATYAQEKEEEPRSSGAL
jgi:hypothetical protein